MSKAFPCTEVPAAFTTIKTHLCFLHFSSLKFYMQAFFPARLFSSRGLFVPLIFKWPRRFHTHTVLFTCAEFSHLDLASKQDPDPYWGDPGAALDPAGFAGGKCVKPGAESRGCASRANGFISARPCMANATQFSLTHCRRRGSRIFWLLGRCGSSVRLFQRTKGFGEARSENSVKYPMLREGERERERRERCSANFFQHCSQDLFPENNLRRSVPCSVTKMTRVTVW